MKSKALKDLMREADRLWSQAIHRSYRGICLYTGSKGVDPHHIKLRRHMATRWNLKNGVLLSREAHQLAHSQPTEFEKWIRGEMGFEAYDRLEKKSRETFQPTVAKMKDIIKELEKKI